MALLRALAARQLYAGMLAAHRAAAAAKLQAAWRGRAARQVYAEQQQAAVVLQSAWRAAAVRQQFAQVLQQKRAACTIQKAWRRHKERQGFGTYACGLEAADAAARTIQCIWRERDQHNSKVRRLQAAVRQYTQLHGAAVVVQRAWRCRAASAALHRAQEQQRRAAFKQQMQRFEQQMQAQQQTQALEARAAGSSRRFLSETDGLAPCVALHAAPTSPTFSAAAAAAAHPNKLHTAPHQYVQGLMQAVPKPVGTGIQFAGLPRAGGSQQRGTPGSPGASSSSSRCASADPAGGQQLGSSPRRAPSPCGHRSSWVLPPPPPAGYGIGYEGINGDRNPLKPGTVAQGPTAGQQLRSSRSHKLFATPPPAAYGVTFPGTNSSNKPADSSSGSGGMTVLRARLLEPAPPAAYGVQYTGIQGSSSSSGSAAITTVTGRPRLWLSSAPGGINGFGSGGSSSGQSSPGRALMNGLKRLGSSASRSGGPSAAWPDDHKPLLLLEEDEDLVRADASPSLPPQERLETRLGGLWEEKGKVSGLLSSWKQRLSSTQA